MNTLRKGWQVVLATTLLFGVFTTATAGSALERRIATYKPICADYERSKRFAECHRPPGSYQAAYEMTGDRRKRALEQGQKAIRMRRDTDLHMKSKLKSYR
tara:strand:+ start:498 stop:800 length:303 start_codon:yes stop_codon:yes gene_type:complete